MSREPISGQNDDDLTIAAPPISAVQLHQGPPPIPEYVLDCPPPMTAADLVVAGWHWCDVLATIGCRHSAEVLARVIHDAQVACARIAITGSAVALEPERRVA